MLERKIKGKFREWKIRLNAGLLTTNDIFPNDISLLSCYGVKKKEASKVNFLVVGKFRSLTPSFICVSFLEKNQNESCLVLFVLLLFILIFICIK